MPPASLERKRGIAGVDLQKPDAEAWATVESAAPETSIHEVDVRDEGSIASVVAAVVERHGGIDVLVNAAGVIGRRTCPPSAYRGVGPGPRHQPEGDVPRLQARVCRG